MKKTHQRIRSIYEDRTRGDSSSKASKHISNTPVAKNLSDYAKRRSSALDCFDFQNYHKMKANSRTPKKPLKYLAAFGEVLTESNPQDEEASPQLKKARSINTGRRIAQMRNLLEAVGEPLGENSESPNSPKNNKANDPNKMTKKMKKKIFENWTEDGTGGNGKEHGFTNINS